MGFTTKGEPTSRVTYVERDDVTKFVNKMKKSQGWDKSDVRNRALMWYAHKFQTGELDDPMLDDDAAESLDEISEGTSWRDVIK